MPDGPEHARSDAAAHYRAVLDGLIDPGEPELLPARLAEAVVSVLPVDGAGVSLYDADFRVPLGANDAQVSQAERLQFTQGQGPCLTAGREGRALVAGPHELTRQWPLFAAELFARTPFRAVMTLPLAITSRTRGALDLFLVKEERLDAVPLAAASRVAQEIAGRLRQVTVAAGAAATDDPELPWLQSPPAEARTVVWLAIGVVMARLDVDAGDALDLLRGHAYGTGRVLDDTAAELVAGRLDVQELRP